jgi:predicted S18 family serine protease
MSKTLTKDKTYFEKYDLYSDANPKDTIRIKYKTLNDVKDTIKKLERLYKQGKYPHNRISQVVNVMTQRLRVIDMNDKRYKLSNKYFDFLKMRTRENNEDNRKRLIFNI